MSGLARGLALLAGYGVLALAAIAFLFVAGVCLYAGVWLLAHRGTRAHREQATPGAVVVRFPPAGGARKVRR